MKQQSNLEQQQSDLREKLKALRIDITWMNGNHVNNGNKAVDAVVSLLESEIKKAEEKMLTKCRTELREVLLNGEVVYSHEFAERFLVEIEVSGAMLRTVGINPNTFAKQD